MNNNKSDMEKLIKSMRSEFDNFLTTFKPDKELYRKLVDFKYNNIKYTIFINRYNYLFFLKKENNGFYSYLDSKTFINFKRIIEDKYPYLLYKFYPIEMDPYTKKYRNGFVELKRKPRKFKLEYSKEEFNTYKSEKLYNISSFNNKVDSIYDANYLDLYFKKKKVTLKTLLFSIDNNKNLSDRYKNILKDYCTSFVSKYPDAQIIILNENLKTLNIIEEDAKRIENRVRTTADGYYDAANNRIYIVKGLNYNKQDDLYVLYHELSHMCRTFFRNDDSCFFRYVFKNSFYFNDNVYIINHFNYLNIIEESLNDLFACSLFNYKGVYSYQLFANYLSVLIDNSSYNLEDYINHGITYLVKTLDKEHGDYNATYIFHLMAVQFINSINKSLKVSPKEFYPIYEYISDFYYKDKINSKTTYKQAQRHTKKLVKKISKNIKIFNVDYFYVYLDKYCKKLGIKKD